MSAISYNDGMIAKIDIDEFCMVVLVNCDGDTQTVSYDSNFFAPIDILRAYRQLWKKEWNMDDELEDYIAKFKKHLAYQGAQESELEEDQ